MVLDYTNGGNLEFKTFLTWFDGGIIFELNYSLK